MILLTGASGTVGTALLRRLLVAGRPVRCLVRDPRELGPERVRVQIALGDLRVPSSFRHAMRGVNCVVHLATATRDAHGASIEELNGLATLRLVRAAEAAGAEHFVLLSSIGASSHSSVRLLRSKAMAERAVTESALATTTLAPSLVVAPRDRWLSALDRLSWLPAMPVPGQGRARFQPIAATDVAACAVASLDASALGRFELAGPETFTHDEIVAAVLRARRRRRRLVHVPTTGVRLGLGTLERLFGPGVIATPDEAALLDLSMVTARATEDAERLGVTPAALATVLASRG